MVGNEKEERGSEDEDCEDRSFTECEQLQRFEVVLRSVVNVSDCVGDPIQEDNEPEDVHLEPLSLAILFTWQVAIGHELADRAKEALKTPGSRQADRDVNAVDGGTVELQTRAAVLIDQFLIKLLHESELHAVKKNQTSDLKPLEFVQFFLPDDSHDAGDQDDKKKDRVDTEKYKVCKIENIDVLLQLIIISTLANE